MGEPWREILIDVEPRGKEFRLGIEADACVGDILHLIQERCQEEGIDIKKWAQKQVGSDFQFVLLRKAEGNAILPPGIIFEDITPEIQSNERFKLGTQPVVGMLPMAIFNRRIDSLVEEFYATALKEIYDKEGWVLEPAKKKIIFGTTRNSQ